MARCSRCKGKAESAWRVCSKCSEELDREREAEEERQQDRCDRRWNTGIYSDYN